MKKLKIAIVDIIGLNYDGTTLTKKGLGGSESSIISIARELAKIGFEVSVFNDCDTVETHPGVYDDVVYRPVTALAEQDYQFDIVISQRTVIPFTPKDLYDQVRQPGIRNHEPELFSQLQRAEQLKIVWMQDTFIWGDHLLEHLLINDHINEVFCISDWHVSYTTNSTHGPRRNFEVLKDRIFLTRNAINRWIDWVDIKQKDPNLFVYNASITKGMIPLVERIWPKIKQRHPAARLKIIGGYYKFRDEAVSAAAQQVMDLQDKVRDDSSIEFTGIITQAEIAQIMATASYNLYPGAYPETSGISSLESINYNTPLIGVRFGAMEETATEAAGYYMDYAIEPNGLFPWINIDHQVDRYVDLVTSVITNPYLHQQKQYACNAVKDVSTWDTVALQWKQHFCRHFGRALYDNEQSRVDWINYRVHKVFGRRYMNHDEVLLTPPAALMTQLPQPRVKVAIIDIVGMSYDGSTLTKKGLGGSESAVILVSEQLSQIGFDITVFNGCDTDGAEPGVYNSVTYRPLSELDTDETVYDVVISSRAVYPFITQPWYNYPQTTNRKIDYHQFERIRNSARLKIFWMHDTFCWGDEILEDLVVNGAIDEVWTLSDFHNMYVMNCSHPRMRNYEVLRRHMWTTRNGLVKYFDSVDLDAKDPNLFIFNANMSKGLDPLLNRIWPRVQQQIPDARLTVIGGFYKLGSAFANDNEETEFMKIAGPHMQNPTITFTGIVSQREVAEISARASYFIYPPALPETYGISTIEALYANTPLLTAKFGALGETASKFSYYIDYAVIPNGLFPNINPDLQTEKFVQMVVDAYNNPAEHRQRMSDLDAIKDLLGWDVVALEWKQHLYNHLGLYLSREESQQAQYTKSKYHAYFGRRFSTPEEWVAPKQSTEQAIIVISPFYNAASYVERCIASVAAQDYDNYEHWLIDDASTDDGYSVAQLYIQQLPENIRDKFRIFRNTENRGAVYNQIVAIRRQDSNSIIMLLDGDDSLVNRPDVFDYYNKIHLDYDFTYGSCWSVVDSIPLISQPYPQEVKLGKTYKDYRFNWNMPYTHLRTFKASLLLQEPDSVFQDESGNWFKAGGDNSTFYRAIENTLPSRIYVVPDIVYNYNDASPINDYKVNRDEQDRAISVILGTAVAAPEQEPEHNEPVELQLTQVESEPEPVPQVEPVVSPPSNSVKRILIAVPTNRNIEAATFKSIYDLEIPDGYTADFQFFWGYSRSQVKNLICEWAKRYDYTIFMRKDGIISRNIINDIISADTDVILLDESLIFCVKKNVILDMDYPHFEPGSTEKEEIENFILKAKTKGVGIKQLINYYKSI